MFFSPEGSTAFFCHPEDLLRCPVEYSWEETKQRSGIFFLAWLCLNSMGRKQEWQLFVWPVEFQGIGTQNQQVEQRGGIHWLQLLNGHPPMLSGQLLIQVPIPIRGVDTKIDTGVEAIKRCYVFIFLARVQFTRKGGQPRKTNRTSSLPIDRDSIGQ